MSLDTSSDGDNDGDGPAPVVFTDCDQSFSVERRANNRITTTTTDYAFLDSQEVTRLVRLCDFEAFGTCNQCPPTFTCTTTDTDRTAAPDCTLLFGSLVGDRVRVACGNRLLETDGEGNVLSDTGSRWSQTELR